MNLKLDIKIFVVTHKETQLQAMNGYVPMMVGAAQRKELRSAYIGDNTGENISEKNCSYSELTGLYWIWKNDHSDYIGLVHYRRFFVKNLRPLFTYRGRYVVKNIKNAYTILTVEDCEKLLSDCDVIVKEKEWRARKNSKILRWTIGDEAWDMTLKVFLRMHPDEMGTFHDVEKMHSHFNCNMFIGKKKIMDKYCEWLFPILQAIDSEHEKSSGQYYCNRELGYISEFLFKVWLIENKIKYKVVPVVNIEAPDALNGVMNVRHFCRFLENKALAMCKKI